MLIIQTKWELEADKLLDENVTIAITTNGTFQKNGAIVTGAGIADWADEITENHFGHGIGTRLNEYKVNIPVLYGNVQKAKFISFPVKHNWWERASITLIQMSMSYILRNWHLWGLANTPLYIPLPGCGNGQLKWPVVETALMDVLRPAVPYLQGEIYFFSRDKKEKYVPENHNTRIGDAQ